MLEPVRCRELGMGVAACTVRQCGGAQLAMEPLPAQSPAHLLAVKLFG